MFKIKSATRLAITIGIACVSLLWLAVGLGLIPNPVREKVDSRIALTRSIAVSVAQFAETHRYAEMRNVLERIRESDDQLISMGVHRDSDRRYIVSAGPHERMWEPLAGNKSTDSRISVSIFSGEEKWGRLELVFRPVSKAGLSRMMQFPIPMIGFTVSLLTLLTWYVLNRTFRYLNPSEVVPTRVKSAFDTIAEGLLLLDPRGEIAHANRSMSHIIGIDHECMVGMNVDDIDWNENGAVGNGVMPWKRCLADGSSITGEVIELNLRKINRKFMVNANSIIGGNGESKGVLVSLDDVTALENKKVELSRLIHTLRRSRDEVERQNEQLNFLASCDPMTKCMNRRAFWLNYERMWEETPKDQLSIAMIDVDHFKAVNDTYGHSVGDQVLIGVGELIKKAVGENGMVCRYGGEEFAVLMADQSFESALELANGIREGFNARPIADLDVTASIGLSSRKFGAMDPQHMLDQADECLYAAKRNGRNRVVRFDECPETSGVEETKEESRREAPIQYSAVTGLLSALSFRSRHAAEHSVRVAELAVAIGPGLLERSELYVLEIAALLHDIGKIGVPDRILDKPGELTPEEWDVLNKHSEIGIEIVRSAFASEEVASIISDHQLSLGGKPDRQDLSTVKLSAASRIIIACDALDSMVSESVYRDLIPVEAAISELRRCSPSQFDPQVVDLLEQHVLAGSWVPGKRSGFEIDTTTAVEIGRHIEVLCSAIESGDVERLQSAVESLRDDAASKQLTPITEATVRLNDAIAYEESDLESVMQLADEVLGLCRRSRSTFVDSAEATVSGSGKPSGQKLLPAQSGHV